MIQITLSKKDQAIVLAAVNSIKVLRAYDSKMYSVFNERYYEALQNEVKFEEGLDANLDVISQVFTDLNFRTLYDGIDAKDAYKKFDCFPPDKIYDLVFNVDFGTKQVIAKLSDLFTMSLELITNKGKSNDKAKKKRTRSSKS